MWSAMWESAQRALRRMPTFDEYLLARPALGAAIPTAPPADDARLPYPSTVGWWTHPDLP